MNDNKIISLVNEYSKDKVKNEIDIEFNLFTLISKHYHHENYHSDILKVFFQSNKNDSYPYLNLFLTYLNSIGGEINLNNFSQPLIYREKGKVDILIVDQISKRAIIVENKINNALDRHRQLPRYVEYVRNNNFECDCIVYLSLNKSKLPETKDWTEKEIHFIRSKIIYSLAFTGHERDLYNGWIAKAEKITTNIDALLVLRQYGALIKKIGGDIMNKVIVEKFYNDMLIIDNFNNAQSIKHMLSDLILFRAEKIIDHFKSNPSPFNNLFVWNNFVAVFADYLNGGHNWSIDVRVFDTEYHFEFWDRNSNDSSGAKDLTNYMGLYDDSFSVTGQRIKRVFKFPQQENELIEYITEFKTKLLEAAMV